jgi:hypothetical protein
LFYALTHFCRKKNENPIKGGEAEESKDKHENPLRYAILFFIVRPSPALAFLLQVQLLHTGTTCRGTLGAKQWYLSREGNVWRFHFQSLIYQALLWGCFDHTSNVSVVVERECRGRDLAPGRDARFVRSHCRAFESFSTIVEKRVYE